jgi:hypothetical protein
VRNIFCSFIRYSFLSFIRKFGPLALFIAAIFIVIEISYRFYTVGPVAFNPFRANSLNTLMRSEYVQLSEFPDVYFELKPDQRGWFKGVRFATNSAGMADAEYPREKPDDAFRVAVVGSSWTMASGVEADQAWHAVLERELNEELPGRNIEILNFGVELYGLREIVGTARHKAVEWDPDLIVVTITNYTTSFLWEEADANQVLPDRAYPFFESYSLLALAGTLGLPGDQPADDRRRLESGQLDLRLSQVQRALLEIGELKNENGVPVVILFLGYVPLGSEFEMAVVDQASQFGMPVVFGNRIFPDAGKQLRSFQISAFDRHPNAAGHQLIADFFGEALERESLLPE